MLPAVNRLKLPVPWNRSPDFQFRTEVFKLIAKQTTSQNQPKLGFIITTKVGKAAERNRLKREFSAILKEKLEGLKIGVEVVIILYPSVTKATNEEISSHFDKVLSKIPFTASR